MNNQEWILREFDEINLGDARLNQRLGTLTTQFFLNPESSIPSACDGWTGSKACYRFFKNQRVDHNKILEAHRGKCIERINDNEMVLVIQDTTFVNYANHHKTTGLGRIGKNKKADSSGLIMHSSLALSEQGLPLGFLDQKIYARPFLDGLKDRNRHATHISEKESYRWLEAFRASIKGIKDPKKVITIADREADMYEFMLEIDKNDSNFLIRAVRDRAINKKCKRSPVEKKIWAHMSEQEIIGRIKTKIQCRNNLNKFRNVELTIKIGSFSIQPSQQSRDKILDNPRAVKMYAIYVQENAKSIKDGEPPIEWMLLTNLVTTDLEAALTRIKWYKFRWRIDLFHKILKSGYRVESCRLSQAERLKRYLTVMSIVSFRILFLTYLQDVNKEANADITFTADELTILLMLLNKKANKKLRKLTISEAINMVGKMGGFFGRKSDGNPGFTTIWKGMKKLSEYVDSYKMIKEFS